jgi:hypothetical protein
MTNFRKIKNAALFCAAIIANQKISRVIRAKKTSREILKNTSKMKTRLKSIKHLLKPARRPCRAGA